jgi:cytochrome P450 family 110
MYWEKSTMQLPLGPQTPAFIQLVRWIFSPMSFMDECVRRFGDMYTLNLGKNNPNLVFVSNPQALQQILTQDTRSDFHAPGDLNSLLKSLLGENSVICLDGAPHQRQRQLMIPPFHGDRMRTYSSVINQVTTETLARVQIGQTFNVRQTTQVITLRVIMEAVFGLDRGKRAEQLAHLLRELLDRSGSPLSVSMLYFPILQQEWGGISPWAIQMRAQRAVDALIYAEIQERRTHADPSRTDILSLLMAAQDEAGESMTDVELRDELMTLLVAGHETTATALAWALYWLHKLPAVKAKLLAELDGLGADPDLNTVIKAPYLEAVCNETLRIYPVAMLTLPRVSLKSVTLAGQEIPPETVVLGSIYSTHQRKDLYPQAHEFKPERFLERQFSPFEFLPFGGGARRCIGSAFAMLELKLALAKIVSRWDLELVDKRDIHAKRRGLVTAPERPIELLVKGHRSAIDLHPVQAIDRGAFA